MKHPQWTLALYLLIIADSAFTIFIGEEASRLMLWAMRAFGINLTTAMVLRVFYMVPLLCIVDRYYQPKKVFVAYVVLYLLGAASTIILG